MANGIRKKNGREMNLDNVKEFIDDLDCCVIATVGNDGKPEAATVGFSCDENMRIVICTNINTRKAVNMRDNPSVALVVGFEGSSTLQYEGIAEQTTVSDLGLRLEQHYEKIPPARRFGEDENQGYYIITPTWIRFTDYTKIPSIFETKEF